MIGVLCKLMICRGNIRTSKDAFQIFFAIDNSIGKFMFKSNFALLSLFQLKFERVVNGLGGQKFSPLSL